MAPGTPSSRTRSPARRAALLLLVAAGYYAAARLGLPLALEHKNVSPVWPPSGVALAALLLCGEDFWPAIFVGAVLANFTTGLPLFTSAGIAAGDTLEAVAASFILARAGFQLDLGRVRDAAWLVLFATPAGSAIAATTGVSMLAMSGYVRFPGAFSAWATWWIGDAMGILIVCPAILAWGSQRCRNALRQNLKTRAGEAAGLAVALAAAGCGVFVLGWDLPYAIFPLIIWAAFRFGLAAASTATLGLCAGAVWATARGAGPFALGSPVDNLMLLQSFMGILSLTGLVVAATLQEREAARAEIATLNQRLQRAMTETHHRVKNNLQLITAMLDTHVIDGRESLSIGEVKRLTGSVQTLAAIHDLLTERSRRDGDAQAAVSARAVLEKLVRLLQTSAPNRAIEVRSADAALTPRQATSLGLIANELISNALKYSNGAVQVSLTLVGQQLTLEVTDSGAGFPFGFDASRLDTTGLGLVDNLARWDLAGDVAFGNCADGGARVQVSFACAEGAGSA